MSSSSGLFPSSITKANDGDDNFKTVTHTEVEEKLTLQGIDTENKLSEGGTEKGISKGDMKEVIPGDDTKGVLPGCDDDNMCADSKTDNITQAAEDTSDKHLLSSNEEDVEVASYPSKPDANAFSTKTPRDDFILRVENKSLHVNKLVLSLFSTVFNDIINGKLKEKDGDELTLTGKKYDDVLEFLQCMYPNVMKPITMDNVYVLLPLAHEYQVQMLKPACEACLLKYLAQIEVPKDLYEILEKACYYRLDEVKEKCVDIVAERPYEEYEVAESKFIFSDDAGNKIRKKVLQNLRVKYKDVFGHVQTSRALHRFLGSFAKQNDLVRCYFEGNLVGNYAILKCDSNCDCSASSNVDGIPFRIVLEKQWNAPINVRFMCQAKGKFSITCFCAVAKINNRYSERDDVRTETFKFNDSAPNNILSTGLTEASFSETHTGFCLNGCIELHAYIFKR